MHNTITGIINWFSEYEDKQAQAELLTQFKLVFKLFIEIFGIDIMSKEQCTLENRPDAEGPKIYFFQDQLQLLTAVRRDVNYGEGLVYDLRSYVFEIAHELLHYAIRQIDKDGKEVNWFEETLCEAMALYGLEYSSVKYFSRRPEITNV